MDSSQPTGPFIDQYPSGRKRDQVQYELKTNISKVPGVEDVWFDDSQTGIEKRIVASFDTSIFAEGCIPADRAAVFVDWFPQPDPPDRFYFHYIDETGYDCGWHRQDQDHVEGLDHFQERESADEEYSYQPINYSHNNAVGLLWEIVGDRLPSHLKKRYESS